MNDTKVESHLIFSTDVLLDLLCKYRAVRMENTDVMLV